MDAEAAARAAVTMQSDGKSLLRCCCCCLLLWKCMSNRGLCVMRALSCGCEQLFGLLDDFSFGWLLRACRDNGAAYG